MSVFLLLDWVYSEGEFMKLVALLWYFLVMLVRVSLP